MNPLERADIYDELNRVLALLHTTYFEGIGLEDFGKTGDFYLRQVCLFTVRVWSLTSWWYCVFFHDNFRRSPPGRGSTSQRKRPKSIQWTAWLIGFLRTFLGKQETPLLLFMEVRNCCMFVLWCVCVCASWVGPSPSSCHLLDRWRIDVCWIWQTFAWTMWCFIPMSLAS